MQNQSASSYQYETHALTKGHSNSMLARSSLSPFCTSFAVSNLSQADSSIIVSLFLLFYFQTALSIFWLAPKILYIIQLGTKNETEAKDPQIARLHHYGLY